MKAAFKIKRFRLIFFIIVLCASLTACEAAQSLASGGYDKPMTNSSPAVSECEQKENKFSNNNSLYFENGDNSFEGASSEYTPMPTAIPDSLDDYIDGTPISELTNEIETFGESVELDTLISSALSYHGLPQENINSSFIVTCLSDELFSCLVYLETDSSLTIAPYTYAIKEQRVCTVADFFSASNTGWKSVLPDIVTRSALERGMTLLCEIPPVTQEQLFYIDGGSIALLYRPYEITTFEFGSPSFVLSMDEIAEYTIGAYGIGG